MTASQLPVTPAELKGIIRTFYQKVFADVMIGFMFQKSDLEDLVDHQLAFSLNMFGHRASYQGQPLREVHFPLKIRGGQFRRRQIILKETLLAHDLSETFVQQWLDKEENLKSHIIAGMEPCH